MSIVTDSSGERPENVYAIHKLLKSEMELSSIYGTNQGNYKALKEALIEDLEKFIAPMRERRAGLSRAAIYGVLEEGAAKARERAAAKMKGVRKKVGVSL